MAAKKTDNSNMDNQKRIEFKEVVGMLTETVQSGSAVIRVHDDSYSGKSKEEIQAIIDEYCRSVIAALEDEKTVRNSGQK